MRVIRKSLLSLVRSRRFYLGIIFIFLSSKIFKSSFVNQSNEVHSIKTGTNYVRHLRLCQADFQQSLELTTFNRTLILYEAEWRYRHQLNILFLLVENIQYPTHHIGNMAPHFANIYSIQCLYKSKFSKGQFRHLNTHEFDRTVIIKCENDQINERDNSTVTLLFTELTTGNIFQMNIHLCWSSYRRVTIGHCHKALFGNVPFHLIKQWLDYHLLIGIEQFYIYDRTLKYKSFLQSYIDRDEVVYIPFPLAKQIVNRERFNWIDQFVGKMHCLMHIRSAFEWLGTWDIDEYLNFYSNHQQIFLPNYKTNQMKSRSMLSEYLDKNFKEYYSIVVYAINYMGKQSLSMANPPVLIEQFQHRLTTWNDRLKYLTKPAYTEFLNIHHAINIKNNLTYNSHLLSPSQITSEYPRTLIRVNHYPSAKYNRDKSFLAFHKGKIEYVHDSILWQVATKLYEENNQRTSTGKETI